MDGLLHLWSELCIPLNDPFRVKLGYIMVVALVAYLLYSLLMQMVFKRTISREGSIHKKRSSASSDDIDLDDSILVGYLWCFCTLAIIIAVIMPFPEVKSIKTSDILLMIIGFCIAILFLSLLFGGLKHHSTALSKPKSLFLLNPLCLICWLPIFNGLWDSTFDSHVNKLLLDFEFNSFFVLAIIVNSASLIRLCIGILDRFIDFFSVVVGLLLAFILTIFSVEISSLMRSFLSVSRLGDYIRLDENSELGVETSVSVGRLLLLGLVFFGNCLILICLNKFHVFINSKMDNFISGSSSGRNNNSNNYNNYFNSSSSSSGFKTDLRGLSIPPDDIIEITQEQAELLMENKLDVTTLKRRSSSSNTISDKLKVS